MKVMPPHIGDLRLNGAGTLLFACPMGNGQLRLILPIMLQSRYRLAITERSQLLQPKINPDLTVSSIEIISNFTSERHVPPPASILHECSSLELTFDLSAFPKTISLLQIHHDGTVDSNCSRHNRNPAQGPFCAIACPKTRGATILIARLHKLATHGLHGVRMQAKIGSAARSQHDQIERRRPPAVRPSLASAFRLTLSRNAEIPHLVACNGKAFKPPITTFDPILERHN